MIPEGFITQLLDRADIVEVIGRSVPLKKKGRHFQACCPFHKEKTPSFMVDPVKQFYKCYGCGESGSAITFLQTYNHLSFPEAVRELASMYHMTVPEDNNPRKRQAMAKARSMTDYLEEAQTFYRGQLALNAGVLQYVKDRRLSDETCARFGLGYSPDQWQNLDKVFGEKYTDPMLVEAGLVKEGNGRRYDVFRGRLMFPIRNARGKVIGFGARTLKGDEQPKYLNSQETPVFQKRTELYGLWEGQQAIRDKKRTIVCEGYMDVIQLSQAGFQEAVATLGTSITSEHAQRLFKLTDSVYFSFDGDAAGQKAARRALENTLPIIKDHQSAGFIILPPEHDPDSLIKAEGPEGYERQIKNAYPITSFMKRLLMQGKELGYVEERVKLLAEARAWVLSMNNAPFLRAAFIKELAGIARMTPDEIERQYGLVKPNPVPAGNTYSGAPSFGLTGRSWGNDDRRSSWGQGGWQGPRRSRGYGYTRQRPEARIAVKDIRHRLLQLFLTYPELINEFDLMIQERFTTSTNDLSQAIIEVWSACQLDMDHCCGNSVSLLSRLSGSPKIDLYEQLLEDEFKMTTPIEGARLELRRTFLELELEEIKMAMEQLAQSPNVDIDAYRACLNRQTNLNRLIQEVQKDEINYRVTVEHAEQQQKERRNKPVTLSSHPIVRQLQKKFAGVDDENSDEPTRSKASDKASEEPSMHTTLSAKRDDLKSALAQRKDQTATTASVWEESAPSPEDEERRFELASAPMPSELDAEYLASLEEALANDAQVDDAAAWEETIDWEALDMTLPKDLK